MSDDTNQADTLIIKPTSIEITNPAHGLMHANGNHSPSKSLKLKVASEDQNDIAASTNGHRPAVANEHIYETPSNLESYLSSSFETPTMSSADEQQANKHDQSSNLSSIYSQHEHPSNNGLDSGLSSETTNATNSGTEMEKTSPDEGLSSTSGVTSTILSAARLLETNMSDVNPKRESSPASGVIIPEEKRVTDRVKVFEAAANQDQSAMKKQVTKNGAPKKSPTTTSSSFSSTDAKPAVKREQTSPVSAADSIDNQLASELKAAATKNKSKRPSLKKQIQNLLKIDKSSSQEESTVIEEQPSSVTNGKKTSTLNSARPKKDSGARAKGCVKNDVFHFSLIRSDTETTLASVAPVHLPTE